MGEGLGNERKKESEELEADEAEKEKNQFPVGAKGANPGETAGPRIVVGASAMGASVAGRIDILAACATPPVGKEAIARLAVHRF